MKQLNGFHMPKVSLFLLFLSLLLSHLLSKILYFTFFWDCWAHIALTMEDAADVDDSVLIRIGFGFNNPKFSDRILRIELTRDPSDSKEEGSEQCGVTTVHINSLVLASQSPFFCKMFSNGMRESEQQAVTLSVHASEDSALLGLLQFMYRNKLKSNASTDLLEVLILADGFQVVACVAHCAQRLSELSMTFELAVSCINLPSSFLGSGSSQLKSLIDTATCFLSKNFCLHFEAALDLPIESIEEVVSWHTLEIDCEDDVYDFLLKWARTHYKNLSERCRVFSSRLCPLIRLPYMSCEKLKSMLRCKELEKFDANKMVVEALLKSIQVSVLYDSPYHECIVYSKITKDECSTIAKCSTEIYTQDFHVGNESFCLKFKRMPEDIATTREFAITLERNWSKSMIDDLDIDLEVAVRRKNTRKFAAERTSSFTIEKGWGQRHCIGKSWDSFMAEDCKYFDNCVLCIRVTLRLRQ